MFMVMRRVSRMRVSRIPLEIVRERMIWFEFQSRRVLSKQAFKTIVCTDNESFWRADSDCKKAEEGAVEAILTLYRR